MLLLVQISYICKKYGIFSPHDSGVCSPCNIKAYTNVQHLPKMSKSSQIQKLIVLKEWIQQMERDSKNFRRHRKTVRRVEDDDETPTFKKEE